ncbi:VOC family protein [Brevibacillus centrosporus]|uniref:VOC family protein n=1 Tax=Brevibacillus centrosporus TaxID=54910 RepID=UPI002E1C7DE8|nr:VOC family protein [Brevibacillus centrosporus]
MKLTHTRLLVKKYQECFSFYKNVLGFKCDWGAENSSYADFEAGNTTLALFDRTEMSHAIGTENLPIESPPSLDKVSLIFNVESVDEMYNSLRDKGIEFITEPTDKKGWGIRVAHFRDPDGTLIEIYEPLNLK